MITTTCCFSGHRKLPINKIEHIVRRLSIEVDALVRQGVTDFIVGGALGFDQISASLIATKKEMGASIRLIFALPCHNQDAQWSSEQKRLYRALLMEADEVRYVSEEYSSDCMKKCNDYMVENSGCCICALLKDRSGTAQTVRYAREKGLRIINVAQ